MEKLYKNLAVTALMAFGGLVVGIFLASKGWGVDILTIVFLAGSTGAVVNNYFRLSKISSSPIMIKEEINKPAVIIQMYVSVLLSGILALVAYGLFLSGILQGELFPDFNSLKDNYISLSNLLTSVSPKTNLDTGKAIVWAFIAGFSERFIPNAIDSLIIKANDKNH